MKFNRKDRKEHRERCENTPLCVPCVLCGFLLVHTSAHPQEKAKERVPMDFKSKYGAWQRWHQQDGHTKTPKMLKAPPREKMPPPAPCFLPKFLLAPLFALLLPLLLLFLGQQNGV